MLPGQRFGWAGWAGSPCWFGWVVVVGTGMLTLPFCGITMNWILPDSIAVFSR